MIVPFFVFFKTTLYDPPIQRNFVKKQNLGPLTHAQYSQFSETMLWWRKVQRLLKGPDKKSRAASDQNTQPP